MQTVVAAVAIAVVVAVGAAVVVGGGVAIVLQLLTKRVEMGTPNREPQEYSRNMIESKDAGRHSPNIPTIFFVFPVWGSQ